jgi:hypothetical protein
VDSILILDESLGTNSSTNRQRVIRFNRQTANPEALLAAVVILTGHTRLRHLEIMAHGRESMVYDDLQQRSRIFGGLGIKMGMPVISLTNASMFSVLNGHVDNIILHSCGIANTETSENYGSVNLMGDGRLLCSYIAAYSGANVFAADITQPARRDTEGAIRHIR